MSSKLYQVTLSIQEQVIATSEEEAFRFALESVCTFDGQVHVTTNSTEQPLATADVYCDAED